MERETRAEIRGNAQLDANADSLRKKVKTLSKRNNDAILFVRFVCDRLADQVELIEKSGDFKSRGRLFSKFRATKSNFGVCLFAEAGAFEFCFILHGFLIFFGYLVSNIFRVGMCRL